MELVKIGKFANTHGLKGEIRILSHFEYKNKVFKKNNILIINKKEYKILTYRVHKIFDMVTFEGINTIDDIEMYKGYDVYFKYEDLKLKDNEYIIDELINYKVIYNDFIGIVYDVIYNNGNNLLNIKGDREILIPLNNHFIKKVSKSEQVIYVRNVEGLL